MVANDNRTFALIRFYRGATSIESDRHRDGQPHAHGQIQGPTDVYAYENESTILVYTKKKKMNTKKNKKNKKNMKKNKNKNKKNKEIRARTKKEQEKERKKEEEDEEHGEQEH